MKVMKFSVLPVVRVAVEQVKDDRLQYVLHQELVLKFIQVKYIHPCNDTMLQSNGHS